MTESTETQSVTWWQWVLSFIPALPSWTMPSKSLQAVIIGLGMASLWYFDKLPSLPAYPETHAAAAPVSYLTASDVSPLIVDLAILKTRLTELEARLADHGHKAPITTGSISKSKKQ